VRKKLRQHYLNFIKIRRKNLGDINPAKWLHRNLFS